MKMGLYKLGWFYISRWYNIYVEKYKPYTQIDLLSGMKISKTSV